MLIICGAIAIGGCDDPVAEPVAVSIDRALLTPSPDVFNDLSDCAPRVLDLGDVTSDYVVWFVGSDACRDACL